MKAFLSVLLVGLILGGCSRGPDAATLEQQIRDNLDSNFREGLFEITSLRRTGSAPVTEAGEDRLLVYYNGQLEFQEDYDLTSWEGLNVGVLAEVLGANEEGIEGVAPGGNSSGDVLRVRGRMSYREEGDAWELVPSDVGDEVAAVPDFDNTAPQSGAEQLLAQIGQIANTGTTNVRGPETVIVEAELSNALRNINLKLDELAGTASLTSGESLGEYFRVGGAIERVVSSDQISIRNYPSAGSVENCALVQDGFVELALVQNDIAAMAYRGQGVFSDRKPMQNLRALANLFPEPIQIVVLASSDIQTPADLAGKTVDIGLPASGSRVNAELVLEAHDVALSDLGEISGEGIDTSVELIQSGDIDAFIVTLAAPAKILQTLAARQPIRVLSMQPEARQRLAESNPYYVPVTLPANTYRGQSQPVQTLSVTAMLIANKDLPDERVTRLLEGLFQNVDAIARTGFQASFISPSRAQQGTSIPLHPGAEKYYSES